MDQHRTSNSGHENEKRRMPAERRIQGEDRRHTNVPVVIERRKNTDRRASSDRREFERRLAGDRGKTPWPA